MALINRPRLLIADEPTTALDVTAQAQILALLADLQQQGLAMLFISHDLAVVGEAASRIAVMRAGRVVEMGPCARLLTRPQHRYAKKPASRGAHAEDGSGKAAGNGRSDRAGLRLAERSFPQRTQPLMLPARWPPRSKLNPLPAPSWEGTPKNMPHSANPAMNQTGWFWPSRSAAVKPNLRPAQSVRNSNEKIRLTTMSMRRRRLPLTSPSMPGPHPQLAKSESGCKGAAQG